jgi:hypothetical protein
VFDLGLRMVSTNARPMLTLGALLVLPVWLGCSVLAWLLPDLGWLVASLAFLLSLPLQLPFTLLGGRLLFSDDVSVREVLGASLGVLGSGVAVWTVYGLAIFFGLAMCVWGALFTVVPTLYLAETVMLERVPLSRALRRSSRLASAHPGTAGAGALGWLGLTVWFAVVGEFGMQALLGMVLQLGSPFGTLYSGDVTPGLLFGIVAAQPAVAIYRLLLYVDVRTRVEGWDLQVRLRAAGLGS